MSDTIFAPSALEAADKKLLPQNKSRGAIYLLKTYDPTVKNKTAWFLTSKIVMSQANFLQAEVITLNEKQANNINQNPSWSTVDTEVPDAKSCETYFPWNRVIKIENLSKRK